jgi:hypothetical protein
MSQMLQKMTCCLLEVETRLGFLALHLVPLVGGCQLFRVGCCGLLLCWATPDVAVSGSLFSVCDLQASANGRSPGEAQVIRVYGGAGSMAPSPSTLSLQGGNTWPCAGTGMTRDFSACVSLTCGDGCVASPAPSRLPWGSWFASWPLAEESANLDLLSDSLSVPSCCLFRFPTFWIYAIKTLCCHPVGLLQGVDVRSLSLPSGLCQFISVVHHENCVPGMSLNSCMVELRSLVSLRKTALVRAYSFQLGSGQSWALGPALTSTCGILGFLFSRVALPSTSEGGGVRGPRGHTGKWRWVGTWPFWLLPACRGRGVSVSQRIWKHSSAFGCAFSLLFFFLV